MRYFFLCLVFASIDICAAPFPDLHKKEYKLAAHGKTSELERTQLSFNPKFFTEINKKRKDIPKEDPLYTDDSNGVGGEDLVLGIIDLTGKGDTYYLTLSDFPSYDITYQFYKKDAPLLAAKSEFLSPNFSLGAPSLVIPSNGFIYSYGHNNNSYSIKNKYTFTDGKINALQQPFKYCGAASKSLKDQTIYSDLTLTSPLYKISKGSPVTIVGLYEDPEKNKEYFLVASEFGLIGYAANEHSRSETQFSGFYFNGD